MMEVITQELGMETFHAKAVDALLTKAADIDAQELVSTCIVRGIQELSQLNVLLLAQKQKKLTDKKRGEIFSHVSGLVNLLMILYHATSTQIPDEDELLEEVPDYPVDYANDGILCSIYMISNLASICSVIFDSEIGHSPDAPTAEEARAIVESSLKELYIGVLVTCDRYEIDFGEILQTAAELEEWA